MTMEFVQLVGSLMTKLTQRTVNARAAVYAAAGLEYIMEDLLELSYNAARDCSSRRIIPRHIFIAMWKDGGFSEMLSGSKATIVNGGVAVDLHYKHLVTYNYDKAACCNGDQHEDCSFVGESKGQDGPRFRPLGALSQDELGMFAPALVPAAASAAAVSLEGSGGEGGCKGRSPRRVVAAGSEVHCISEQAVEALCARAHAPAFIQEQNFSFADHLALRSKCFLEDLLRDSFAFAQHTR